MIEPIRDISRNLPAIVRKMPAIGTAGSERVEPVVATCYVRLDRRADFLAQLIAERDSIGPARRRRRADPTEAIAAYNAVAELARPDYTGVSILL